jgi:uncharacterized cupredoxin-like copper-binding protein
MTPRRLAAVAVLALAASACGSPATPAGAAASQLRVGLSEFEIAAVPAAARAGTVTLTVTNAGATAHDLVVDRENAPPARTDVLSPGETARLAVVAAAGEELRLSCSLPGHQAQGMELVVAVRGAA